ncbi:hypothetical protein ACGFYV_24670 [Streptomyces sp. NPDC048297]|uniref:hypothetical protein n=1 Tax=Streptomyces sp. NPDC048297 TaxID=3365531 RepID=UPI00371345DF
MAALRRRFPQLRDPPSEDIRYAAQNRQAGMRRLAVRSELVLVVGSPDSHNTNRLVQVSLTAGTPAHLVRDAHDIRDEWLERVRVVGVTAGAPAPPALDRRRPDGTGRTRLW